MRNIYLSMSNFPPDGFNVQRAGVGWRNEYQGVSGLIENGVNGLSRGREPSKKLTRDVIAVLEQLEPGE